MRTLLLRCEDCDIQFEIDNEGDAFECGIFRPIDEDDLIHESHELSSYWGGTIAELHDILREGSALSDLEWDR